MQQYKKEERELGQIVESFDDLKVRHATKVSLMPLILALLVLSIFAASCTAGSRTKSEEEASNSESPPDAQRAEFLARAGQYEKERARMVADQIQARGIANPFVLEAMRTVERHEFVPQQRQWEAYADRPLPIGNGQTISQPFIVAFMTEALNPKKTDKVLEIGTGCGYQAAVLSKLVSHVYTIEIVDELAKTAKERLARLSHNNVSVRSGDGYAGWTEQAPFDSIIVTAAPESIPPKLIEQLKPGGRLIAPVGKDLQDLILVTKNADGSITRRTVMAVRFVPMTGQAQSQTGGTQAHR